MTITVLLILAIAAALVPLIRRDLRIAHARIEERRRLAAMTPFQRFGWQLNRTAGRIALGLQAFGMVYRAAAVEEDLEELRKALRRAARRRRDRWSLR